MPTDFVCDVCGRADCDSLTFGGFRCLIRRNEERFLLDDLLAEATEVVRLRRYVSSEGGRTS